MHRGALWPSSLRGRLLVVIATTLLPVLAISLHVYYDQRAESRAQARERALAIAVTVAAEQGHVFARAEELLRLVAADVTAIAPGGLANLDLTACTALLTAQQKYNPQFSAIGFIDAEGVARCGSVPGAAGISVADRAWFRDVSRTEVFTASTVILSRVDGAPTISVARPVWDPAGLFMGAVGGTLDFEALNTAVGHTVLPEGAALTVTDLDGVIIARNPDPDLWTGTRWQEAAQIQWPTASGGGLTHHRGVDGIQRLYVATFLEAGSAGVVGLVTMGLPSDVVYGSIARTFRTYLLALALVAIIALATAWVGGERILLRPIRRLQNVVRRVAAGDLEARTGPPYARGELGQLGSLVDGMAQSLSDQFVEISELNHDLTRRVRARTEELASANRQLSEANRELETFAYSVSHDLRAPLRAIDGFSLTLLREYDEQLDERGQDRLRRIREAAQRLDTLIDDVLKLSRTTRAPLRLETVDLSASARLIAQQLREEAPDRDVQFTIADGMVAETDPALLAAVLENLLGNAWKFTSRHASAHIEFGLTERDGERVFFVRDDGAGFDMQYASKLFGPFQRLHTPAEFAGNGIGLANVQRIVHRHGGRIWAEGSIEHGATFYFTLNESAVATDHAKEAA